MSKGVTSVQQLPGIAAAEEWACKQKLSHARCPCSTAARSNHLCSAKSRWERSICRASATFCCLMPSTSARSRVHVSSAAAFSRCSCVRPLAAFCRSRSLAFVSSSRACVHHSSGLLHGTR